MGSRYSPATAATGSRPYRMRRDGGRIVVSEGKCSEVVVPERHAIVHCPLPIAHCPLPIAHCPNKEMAERVAGPIRPTSLEGSSAAHQWLEGVRRGSMVAGWCSIDLYSSYGFVLRTTITNRTQFSVR